MVHRHISFRFSTLLAALICTSVMYGQIAINEFNSQRGFTDENGEDVDWVEVYNYSNGPISLDEFYLSDNPNNLDKWQFPAIELPSQQLITICASGRENSKVPNHWESLVKANNVWKYWSGNTPPVNYGNWNQLGYNDQNWSSGQGGIGYGDNDDNTIISATPSVLMRREFVINDLSDITNLLFHADYDDGFIAYLNGVEIMRSSNLSAQPAYNEFTQGQHEAVMYSGGVPEHVLFDATTSHDLLQVGANVLAVRVHNATANSSDMTGNFFLSAGIASTAYDYQSLPQWIVPPTVLPHADFKLSHGETVVISDTSENIIDSAYISSAIKNSISRGRTPDGVGSWCFFDGPTPNASNNQSTCYTGVVPAPQVNLASGWYGAANPVTVTTAPNATSYYTTNGDVPDAFDNEVNGTIYITETSVLSVRSFSNSGNALPSETVDRTYIINEDNHDLPVVSIITNEDHLWNWYTGIYVMGPNASTNYPYFGSNFWQPWSRKSRMEFFDGTQTKQFEAEFDLEIHGGWSRAEAQKSFRVDAKSIYTGEIEYSLIERKPHITSYNNFNLRNGGQHGLSDRLQDAIMSRLAQGTEIDRMGYQPCIVYLNGSYWGLYGIREKLDEHYVESNHGVPSDEVQLMNRDGSLVGSSAHFTDSYDIIMNTSTASDDFVEIFSSRFDLDNYIDYFVFQTYIQNRDWLGIDWGLNNVKLWRQDTIGATWRYMMYDTDFAFGLYGGNIYQNYIDRARNPTAPNDHSELFDHVLDNDDFMCRFTNRYDDLINTTFQSTNFDATTDELKAALAPAIPDHIANWSSQMGPYSFTSWSNAVNSIKSYNANRIATSRQHINQSFSLYGQRDVDLDAYPSGAGAITINSITPELPWEGVYHGGCPINAQATPHFGYVFSHWTSNDGNYNNEGDDSLEILLNTNTELVANFDTCSAVIDVDIVAEGNVLRSEISEDVSGVVYNWTLNGITVSEDSVIFNPSNGNYGLTVRFDSCEIATEIFTVERESYSLLLFPNPAIDQLHVQFILGTQSDMNMRIFNTSGQEVWQNSRADFIGQFNETIDVSGLARGTYILRVETPTEAYAERFILI